VPLVAAEVPVNATAATKAALIEIDGDIDSHRLAYLKRAFA
jgi:hypothetical protein